MEYHQTLTKDYIWNNYPWDWDRVGRDLEISMNNKDKKKENIPIIGLNPFNITPIKPEGKGYLKVSNMGYMEKGYITKEIAKDIHESIKETVDNILQRKNLLFNNKKKVYVQTKWDPNNYLNIHLCINPGLFDKKEFFDKESNRIIHSYINQAKKF